MYIICSNVYQFNLCDYNIKNNKKQDLNMNISQSFYFITVKAAEEENNYCYHKKEKNINCFFM